MDIKLITFLISFSSIIIATKVEITDLSNNPGLLVLVTGKSFLKVGDHKIYHTINLDAFQPAFNKLRVIIDELSSFNNYSELTNVLKVKFSNIENLYFGLLPRKRAKRGLLNFAGAAIKEITGNMDHEDFLEISNDLNKLKFNNQQLITENNRQIKVNLNMQERINDIIKQLKEQRTIISKNLIGSRYSSGFSKDIIIFKEIFNINVNLDHLKFHLQSVVESVHLAKLGIISKNILYPDELGFASEKLEEKGIVVKNMEEIYSYLNVVALFNESQLIFVVKVPILQNEAYNSLILEALPIGQKILKVPAAAAMTSRERTYFITKNCQRIEGNLICTQSNLLDYTSDTCFPNLLRGLHGNCTFQKYEYNDAIKSITSNHLLIKSRHLSHMNSTCGLNHRNITGIFLIEFHNCSITVNKTTITNLEIIQYERPFILPLQGLNISEREFDESLSIQDLQIENRRHILDLTRIHENHTIATFGISSFSVILGLIIVIYLLKANFRVRMFDKQPNEILQRKQAIAEPTSQPNHTHRDVASSGGGVVKDQSSPDKQTTAPEPASKSSSIVSPSIVQRQHNQQHSIISLSPPTITFTESKP